MKKFYSGLLAILLVCTAFFSGCTFFSSNKLKAPTLEIDKTTQTLTWGANYNATSYAIYINDKAVHTVEKDDTLASYSFDYSADVALDGVYRFQVQAIGGKKHTDSDLSNTVVHTTGSASSILNRNLSTLDYEYNIEYEVKNVSVTNNLLTWNEPNEASNVDGYIVSIFTNTNGVKNYNTNICELMLTKDMNIAEEVMAIAVYSIVGGINYETKNLYYYNPIDNDNFDTYTDKFYVFDGKVFDFYITNWQELQNLYYYAFIYRLDTVSFMVEENFHDNNQETYFETIVGRNIDYITNYAWYETCSFPKNNPPHLEKISGENCFKLVQSFYNKEPQITGIGASTPSLVQETEYEPYYNTVDYPKRNFGYEFKSDNWYLSAEVDSSEELFWAVSNHVTPVFTGTKEQLKNNRAYVIYEKAKAVLMEIISDEMTEYEKILSIFDYIAKNAIYDYNAFYGEDDNPMLYSCYYLEGLFMTDNKLVVCDGYSKAFSLLCNIEGINCVRIMGRAGGGGHAWNKVELDGEWYVVDLTWTERKGASDWSKFEQAYMLCENPVGGTFYNYAWKLVEDTEDISHLYFLVDDGFIADTHSDFENREIFSMLPAPQKYNFYENENYSLNGTKFDNVITTIEELRQMINYCLANDFSGMEIVIDDNLFYEYYNSGSITETIQRIFIDAKFSFSAVNMNYLENQVEASYIAEGFDGNIESPQKILYWAQIPQNRIIYTYYSEEKAGIYLLFGTNVSLTTEARLSDYMNYVKSNNILKQTGVSMTKEKIYDWVQQVLDKNPVSGYSSIMLQSQKTAFIDALSDEERLSLVEDYFISILGSKNVSITRTSADVVESMYTQDEMGIWAVRDLTIGKFNFVFE